MCIWNEIVNVLILFIKLSSLTLILVMVIANGRHIGGFSSVLNNVQAYFYKSENYSTTLLLQEKWG